MAHHLLFCCFCGVWDWVGAFLMLHFGVALGKPSPICLLYLYGSLVVVCYAHAWPSLEFFRNQGFFC
ncbi:hypothetical protein BJ508DRAFT_416617 [Ascobolus immersus RN42]|uniref:Uncharacterized protein n=1 Tax=Ascobolus immersus RN42 TaxID=1160509 RepID=A0A3N4I0P2_ASCIM|nr:hypothetical protein BJ508DRAFT_416617 [Ascobolus immersus RN42]